MQIKTPIQVVRHTAPATNARRSGPRSAAVNVALVAGWSVCGLALALIATVGRPGVALAESEALAVLCCVGLAALAGIVTADLQTPR